jgi:fucose 4-O-acetylase-like acetyltransferase
MNPPEPVAPKPGSPRMAYWDNVRFVAIALVVVGHTISNFSAAPSMTATYFVVYAFHMPLFAFVSGHFASTRPLTRTTAFATVRQLLAPYVIFSVLWFGLRLGVEGGARLDLGSPYQFLWFLLALFVWRMALPYIAALRFPVLVSVGVATLAGYFNSVGTTLEGGKILGMLPFFVLGWAARERGWTSPENLRRLTSGAVRAVAAAVLLIALALSYFGVDAIRDLGLRKWARMGANYVDLGVPEWWGGAVRLALIGLAVLLGVAALALVPYGRSIISTWGTRTMYVYLLHLTPIYLIGELTDAYEWFDSVPRFALACAMAVAWAAALSTGVVRRIFRPLIEPELAWLRPKDEPAASAGAGGTEAAASPITAGRRR